VLLSVLLLAGGLVPLAAMLIALLRRRLDPQRRECGCV
jgi:hypothetical protein